MTEWRMENVEWWWKFPFGKFLSKGVLNYRKDIFLMVSHMVIFTFKRDIFPRK